MPSRVDCQASGFARAPLDADSFGARSRVAFVRSADEQARFVDDQTKQRAYSGLRPWPKGVSGNPGGRPKGLRQQLIDMGVDEDLKARMYRIWKGEEKGFGPRERMQAGQWLGDRLYGKALDLHAIAQLDPGSEASEAIGEIATAALSRIAGALTTTKALKPKDAIVDLLPEISAPVTQNPKPSDETK